MIANVVAATVVSLEEEPFFLGGMKQSMILRVINSILC